MANKGLLIVHTGNGKGKTTAALGMAMRAAGHGFKVCVIQFIKGKWSTGEARFIEAMNGKIELHTLGTGFSWDAANFRDVSDAAKRAWAFAREKMTGDQYDMIVLDELTHLVSLGILEEEELVEGIEKRPDRLHVIVTGRNAGELLVRKADLVTEMREIKHPFVVGGGARKGIEY